jgi:prevent-host-death family protein
MPLIDKVWQASEARNNLPEVMKRALSGSPQLIRHRSGEEVVMISRADYDAMRPTLKEYLLHGGPCADDDDELERIIARNRSKGITLMGRLPFNDE